MKISMREKISYGVGDFGSNLIWSTMSSFVLYYYTNIAGLAAGLLGTLFLISRVFDAVIDLGVGFVIDRTHTKMGKARPWLFGVSVPLAISLVLVFTIPTGLSTNGKLIYIFIVYNVLAALYSFSNISYNTMLSLIAEEQEDRTLMNSLRFIFAIGGVLFISYLTMPLVSKFGGGQKGWTLMAAAYGVLYFLINLIPSFGTKEKNFGQPADTEKKYEKIPLSKSLKLLFANKYWVILVVFFIINFINGGISGVGTFFAIDVLKNPAMIGTLGMASMLPVIIGLFFAPAVINKLGGKRKAAIIGLVVSMIGMIPTLLIPTNASVILVCFVIKSLGTVPLTASMYAFTADVVEYGEWKTGTRVEGMTYSAVSFGIKLGTGIGAAIQGWLLAFGGYVNGAASQSDLAKNMITAMYIYIPFALTSVTLILLYMLKIDDIYPQIMADLKARREGKNTVKVQTNGQTRGI